MTEKTRPCEICGEMIEAERVKYLPETRLCRIHAAEVGKFGGELRVLLHKARLSKPGSMKGNDGDVAVVGKERNTRNIERLRTEFERNQQ